MLIPDLFLIAFCLVAIAASWFNLQPLREWLFLIAFCLVAIAAMRNERSK